MVLTFDFIYSYLILNMYIDVYRCI